MVGRRKKDVLDEKKLEMGILKQKRLSENNKVTKSDGKTLLNPPEGNKLELETLEKEENLLMMYYNQYKLNEYELYADYLEVMLNYAYLILFASAFPLAPLIILVFHFIEILSDKFKIKHLYRRSMPQNCDGILVWGTLINIINIVAVLSNIVLFAFSSDQIEQFFPYVFILSEKLNQSPIARVSEPATEIFQTKSNFLPLNTRLIAEIET